MRKPTTHKLLVRQLQSLVSCKAKIVDFKDWHKTQLNANDFDKQVEALTGELTQWLLGKSQ